MRLEVVGVYVDVENLVVSDITLFKEEYLIPSKFSKEALGLTQIGNLVMTKRQDSCLVLRPKIPGRLHHSLTNRV